MLKSDYVIRTVKRAAENPEATVGEVMAEPWYELLSDTDQSEFWTQLLVSLQRHYGEAPALRVGEELDKHVPYTVRDTVTANFRHLRHIIGDA